MKSGNFESSSVLAAQIFQLWSCMAYTIGVNWFDPKLLVDLPRKLFTILELSQRRVLFTIFLGKLLTTLEINFDIQL